MPDHDQARIDSMEPGKKKKARPLSAIIIFGIFVTIILVLVLQ